MPIPHIPEERQAAPTQAENLVVHPVQATIGFIQGTWKPGILVRLERGPARLGQLGRVFPSASKKMWVQHLRELEEDGFIVRTDLNGKMRHVEYWRSRRVFLCWTL
jgi:DNA-binding HxlR family transcriptional regulator